MTRRLAAALAVRSVGFAIVHVAWALGWRAAAIALTVFAALAFRDSGEKVPELKKDEPPTAPPAA